MLANLPRARNIMVAEGIDAVILVTPINVLYGSDLASEFMLGRFEDYTTAVVLPRDDSVAPSLVLPEFDLPFLIEAGSWIENVYCYGNPWSTVGLFMGESLEANLSSPLRKELQLRRAEQKTRQEASFIDALCRVIKDSGLSLRHLACDDVRLAGILEAKSVGSQNKIVDALQVMRRIRLVKTEAELALLTKGAQINAQALGRVIAGGSAGMLENHLTQIYRRSLVEAEARHLGDRGMMFGSGEGSSFSLPIREDRFLVPGESVVLDCLGTYGGYHMDLARTAVVGDASGEQIRRYRAAVDALEAVETAIKPGMHTQNLRKIVRQVVDKHGLRGELTSVTTHGLGLEVFEFPYADSLQNGFELEEGMVVNTEVFYRDVDYGGFHLEDSVVVTGDGCSLLCEVSRDLVVFH